ncbi:hypothetical protein [Paenisporosarcina cavernae]|uniref:Type VI secretion system spike protein VgrG3-like C-terminal domain-containing protein n=1 Tax=Paenisporosarcina cavernae TaxID=2320858 RepID=A0A385YWT4_9BACL|nr:hypothetical protein [Paenisporosarcina cavernae]AYC30003.1 hypothetical protein D3873_09010 [Paenisporosarcina cavernae]
MAAINQSTLNEIYKKSQAGIAMSAPTKEKQAIYDMYKSSPKVKPTSGGINDYQMNEIIRKAQSGIQLDKPTGEKNAIYNAYANVKPKEPTQATNYIDQINAMFEQQKQAQLAQFNAQRDRAIGQINQQKAELAPAYADKRNQADVVNAQNVSKLRELMAANGLTASGENVTSQVALGSARQGALNQLNMQEQQQRNDYDRRISDLNDPREIESLMAALEADKSKALLESQRYQDQMNYQRERDSVNDGWRQNEWNYQTGRDNVSDNRWQQQWDYQKSRDAVGDKRWNQEFQQDNQRYAQEKAWREYTYKNMSASEKAQMAQNASQFGEEMAWKMYALEYQGEVDKSIAQTEMEGYMNGGNFPSGTGLGALSQKYESSGNPGTVARNAGDIGGASYGSYQLTTASGNAQAFANKYGGALKGLKAGTSSFDNAWKQEAVRNPSKFANAQHSYIKATHFDPVVKANPWILKYPKAVQDAVWSTAVQHGVGGAKNILNKVARVGMTPQAMIKAIYNERGRNNGLAYFPSSSANIRQSVVARFQREKNDALSMLRG